MRCKLQRGASCQRMDTSQNRYSSFKVTAECDKVSDMCEPHLWPDGVFVRSFYGACKSRTNNSGPGNAEFISGVRDARVPEAHVSVGMKP